MIAVDRDEEDAPCLDLAPRLREYFSHSTWYGGAGERRVIDLVVETSFVKYTLHLRHCLASEVGYCDRLAVTCIEIKTEDQDEDQDY